jgi:glycosyltransferase involved in cell wall biosynthesis
MEGFMALLQGALTGLHEWLLGPDSGVSGNVTDWPLIGQTSPDLTYGNPDVQHLQDTVRLAAEAGMSLVLVWGGLNRVARPYLGSTYHDLREFGPRVVLGLVLVHTARWWGAVAIDLNNALARVVGTDRPPGWLQLNGVHQVLVALVLTLVQAVMYLLLLLQQLMRLALIDVLLVPAVRPRTAMPLASAAQAMGKPVIVTATGALPELVMPAVTGWLLPADDPGEIAWALDLALKMGDDVRDRVARRAREFALTAFAAPAVLEQQLELYGDLLRPAGVPPQLLASRAAAG